MLSESEFSVVDRIAGRVADLFYFTKIPHEDRVFWSPEDLRQELLCHLLHRLDKYDTSRSLGPWARAVIYNRARTIVMDLWHRADNRGQTRGTIDVDRVYFTQYESSVDGEAPTAVFICEATPEDVLIILDEILAEELHVPADRGVIEMADSKPTETTVEEIRDLAGIVGVKLNTDDEPLKCLEDVLFFALNDMDEAKFDELEKDTRERIQYLGDQYMAEEIQIVRRNGSGKTPPPDVAKAEPKKTRSKSTTKKKPAGKKKAAKSTAKKVTKKAKRDAVVDSTVPTGTGPKSAAKVKHATNPDGTATRQHFDPDYLQAQAEKSGRKGVVYWIRHFFGKGKGLTTAPEICEALKDKRIRYSSETVRTHVRDLCKFYGVEHKHSKRGPKGRGVQNAIEDAYASGKRTVAEVAKYLEKKKIDAAPATIKSAVSALRRNDPEIQKARAKKKAAKSTAKKKPAGKKKTAKSTTKKKAAKSTAKKKPAARKGPRPSKKKAASSAAKSRRADRDKKADPPTEPPPEEQTVGTRSARRRSSRRRSEGS